MLLLLCWALALRWLSSRFDYEQSVLNEPVGLFVALQMAAGGIYLATLAILRKLGNASGWIVAGVIGLGLLMRLAQFGASPILEDDFYRYLWDGGVTAAGLNPYAMAPQSLQYGLEGRDAAWRQLEVAAGPVLDRVNHPTLRTIYPPVAQAAFAVSHGLAPFDIAGLRILWLALDVAILSVLMLLLRGDASRLFKLAIYWLNPLLVKEVFNSGHMEPVLILFLALALWAAFRRAGVAAAGLLAIAGGAKLWPVILLPLFLRCTRHEVRWKAVVLHLGLLGMLMGPLLLTSSGDPAGLAAYAERWRMNDSFHQLLYEPIHLLFPEHACVLTRGILGLLLLAVLAVCLGRYRAGDRWLIGSSLFVVAWLFLLSPTQFPWYFLWVLPLLAIRPVWSLIALTATLPLYYLRFPMDALGLAGWFDHGLVWLEFFPVTFLLFELRGWGGRAETDSGPESERTFEHPEPQVAVVIPAWNEEQAIGRVVKAIPPEIWRVIVVDNGSTDRTALEAVRHGAWVISEPNRGYGAACMAGIRAAVGADILVFMDGDYSDRPEEIPHLLAPILEDRMDLVIGSRVLGAADPGSLTLQQRFGNTLACRLIRLFYGASFTDLGPFRAIRTSSLLSLEMSDRNFGWTVQMQVRAAMKGLKCMEVPVSYRKRIGQSKISGTVSGCIRAGSKILLTVFGELFWSPESENIKGVEMARTPEEIGRS